MFFSSGYSLICAKAVYYLYAGFNKSDKMDKQKEQFCVCGHSSTDHSATLTDLMTGGDFKCHKCNCKKFYYIKE